MNNCGQDNKTDLHNIKFSARILRMLRYLKEPVEVVSELYNRYPDGGEWGWFAIVTSLNTIAVWNVKDRKWQPMNAFGDFVQADWEETDEQAAAYIRNKPDLNAITTNEPYVKYYEDILTANGKYRVHTSKNLMYAGSIEQDAILTWEKQITEKGCYGTTYMLLKNLSDRDVSIGLETDTDAPLYAVGFDMDKPLIIAPEEWMEIAVKGYGEISVATCINGKGIVIPEQVQADWRETDKNAKSFIRNKPDLWKLAANEAYNKLYPDIVKSNGGFQLHPHKDLMYCAAITEDLILSEVIADMAEPRYGTTYLLLTNPTEKGLEIRFDANDIERLSAIGFDIEQAILLESEGKIEIAVKGYGDRSVVTCITDGEKAGDVKEYYSVADRYPFDIVTGEKIFVHPTKTKHIGSNVITENCGYMTYGDSTSPRKLMDVINTISSDLYNLADLVKTNEKQEVFLAFSQSEGRYQLSMEAKATVNMLYVIGKNEGDENYGCAELRVSLLENSTVYLKMATLEGISYILLRTGESETYMIEVSEITVNDIIEIKTIAGIGIVNINKNLTKQ